MKGKASITVGELKQLLNSLDVSDDTEVYWRLDGCDVLGSIEGVPVIHEAPIWSKYAGLKTVSLLIDND